MISIVRNHNQVPQLKSKYILKAYSATEGEYLYAKIGLKPIIGYVLCKLKYHNI